MKKVKLQELTDAEIQNQLSEARQALRNHRFQYGIARSLENPKIIQTTRRKIARLLTIQRERANKAEGTTSAKMRGSRKVRLRKNLAKRNAVRKVKA